MIEGSDRRVQQPATRHRRIGNTTGGNGVGPDPVLTEFVSDATDDVVDAGLGAHVRGVVVEHDAGCDRRDLDD
ncbi:hypothetical protein D9M69_687430 [compost metagenome]